MNSICVYTHLVPRTSEYGKGRVTCYHLLDLFSEMGAPGYIKVLEERLLDIGD